MGQEFTEWIIGTEANERKLAKETDNQIIDCLAEQGPLEL